MPIDLAEPRDFAGLVRDLLVMEHNKTADEATALVNAPFALNIILAGIMGGLTFSSVRTVALALLMKAEEAKAREEMATDLFLFVWDRDFLRDCSSGMGVAVAATVEEARDTLRAILGELSDTSGLDQPPNKVLPLDRAAAYKYGGQ